MPITTRSGWLPPDKGWEKKFYVLRQGGLGFAQTLALLSEPGDPASFTAVPLPDYTAYFLELRAAWPDDWIDSVLELETARRNRPSIVPIVYDLLMERPPRWREYIEELFVDRGESDEGHTEDPDVLSV